MSDSLFVQVIDPAGHAIYPAQVVKTGEGYRLERKTAAEAQEAAPNVYLSPGWIDLHTHVYDGMTSISVPADDVGIRTGVHLVVDAGSSGEATLPGFRKYVVPRAVTQIRAWLNISSIGLVHLREVSDLSLISVDRTVQAIVDNQPFVCGVKVRASGAIVGSMGTQPLRLAKLAARETGLPLMVHIGEAPPTVDEVLDLLEEGDVVTHCFHGKIGHPWGRSGLPEPALERALARGVKLDVGHGAASFSFDICKKAMESGHAPFSISTDVHIRNINGPVHNLATTMSKMLGFGMPLPEVIAAVTAAPADVLRLPHWCGLDGTLKQATLFRIEDNAGRTRVYRDSKGVELVPERTIEPMAVICGEEWINLTN
ncbi:amidohydrolase/deacetylase family metallohydrolase [Paenibacillus hodogayensis]|uniref:Amidohydrolase/deacetylase family metallohydrolase n=1 Tax=Paenibacillus hodogayensis TaxID=279208 RepID=A0ABV5W0P1_9BACL